MLLLCAGAGHGDGHGGVVGPIGANGAGTVG